MCSLTRYRFSTVDNESIVDAAHIHSFSDSGNNDPRNGLALCKNAHWLFDRGLWTLSDDYKVVVARNHIDEESLDPGTKKLADYHGRRFTCQRMSLPGEIGNTSSGTGITDSKGTRMQLRSRTWGFSPPFAPALLGGLLVWAQRQCQVTLYGVAGKDDAAMFVFEIRPAIMARPSHRETFALY